MLKIYDIPRYQREYTWNQRDWANLYDDITQNDAGYFLGSFIVVNGTVNSKMIPFTMKLSMASNA